MSDIVKIINNQMNALKTLTEQSKDLEKKLHEAEVACSGGFGRR